MYCDRHIQISFNTYKLVFLISETALEIERDFYHWRKKQMHWFHVKQRSFFIEKVTVYFAWVLKFIMRFYSSRPMHLGHEGRRAYLNLRLTLTTDVFLCSLSLFMTTTSVVRGTTSVMRTLRLSRLKWHSLWCSIVRELTQLSQFSLIRAYRPRPHL